MNLVGDVGCLELFCLMFLGLGAFVGIMLDFQKKGGG